MQIQIQIYIQFAQANTNSNKKVKQIVPANLIVNCCFEQIQLYMYNFSQISFGVAKKFVRLKLKPF